MKITSDALEQIVFDLFMTLATILARPIVVEEKYHDNHARYEFTSGCKIDLWNDIPPSADVDGFGKIEIVIVPRQIEESALALSLKSRVYEHEWALSEGQTQEDAIEEAKQRYLHPPNSDSESECDSESEFKSESSFDMSIDDDFSVYDDDESDPGRKRNSRTAWPGQSGRGRHPSRSGSGSE